MSIMIPLELYEALMSLAKTSAEMLKACQVQLYSHNEPEKDGDILDVTYLKLTEAVKAWRNADTEEAAVPDRDS